MAIQGVCQIRFLDFPTLRLPRILLTGEGCSVKPTTGWVSLAPPAPRFAKQKTSSPQEKYPVGCMQLCQKHYLHRRCSCQEKAQVSRPAQIHTPDVTQLSWQGSEAQSWPEPWFVTTELASSCQQDESAQFIPLDRCRAISPGFLSPRKKTRNL